jgi:uncharacterized glyoxalase superfamily protein PhnB
MRSSGLAKTLAAGAQASAEQEESRMTFGRTTPILRIFDEAKAKEFYVDFLGFKVDWEHRFEDNLPLYMQLSKDGCIVHLSEHHGDCSPGAQVRIETDELEAFQNQLLAKQYKYARPGIQKMPWGEDMTVGDPFGNRLTFTSAVSS